MRSRESKKLAMCTSNLIKCFMAIMVAVSAGNVSAEQMPNPRATSGVASSGRDGSRSVNRNSGSATVSRVATTAQRRTTTSRAATTNNIVSSRNARTAVTPVGATRSATVARTGVVGAMRAGYAPTVTNVRVATTANASRAAVARATAVFDDVSKIGGGYATCREAYSTCMDQFCAKANDTYRRCFCSSKFTEFRDTEAALDEAKNLLVQFENNNLNAVDKTAAEVNAMYTATEGERAIKNDTSGAAAMLSEIGDLLSGKRKVSASNSGTSLGVLDLDFSTNLDDIWSGGDASSIFTSSGTDLSQLEGQALYTQAQKQCLSLMKDACENNAVMTMAKSSYNILISQDCNAYEKKVNSQRETIKQTVRTAEKYLRDARLEEYRSHNSADVNECIAKVKTAITADTACGANYKKCLDYTGAYVDANTGDPIYSPRLFELENLITLDGANGNTDVLSQNGKFNSFLETRKMFATTALDSCRDISTTVWQEFKRSALIEIAQAQSAKIEEVKMSCVSTMADCYDTQTNALKDFDTTTASAAGAVSAYAAKALCQDKVTACAALYGNNTSCQFDGNGKLTSDAASCGIKALLAFVDNVDTVRVAEGCSTAIDNYVKQLCTPSTGAQGYPWNCRRYGQAQLRSIIENYAVQNCKDPTKDSKQFAELPDRVKQQVSQAISDVQEELDDQLADACESLDGFWTDADDTGKLLTAFYSTTFGKSEEPTDTNTKKNALSGRCVENSERTACLAYNTGRETPVATYDSVRGCVLTDVWYQERCTAMNGYYETGNCYLEKDNSDILKSFVERVLSKITIINKDSSGSTSGGSTSSGSTSNGSSRSSGSSSGSGTGSKRNIDGRYKVTESYL